MVSFPARQPADEPDSSDKENDFAVSIDMIKPTEEGSARVLLGALQPTDSRHLEVDEMGLFRPRTNSSLDELKPKFSQFNEPISKEAAAQGVVSVAAAPSLKKSNQPEPAKVGSNDHTTVSLSISDRRYAKLAAKEETARIRVVAGASPAKLQLPIKDTSERDPSELSEVRAHSETVPQEVGQKAGLGGAMLAVSGGTPVTLQRQSTCVISNAKFFSQSAVPTANASSAKSKGKDGSLQGRWTDEEHRLFLEGLELFNKDWRSIEKHIGTRTCSQIRSHAQKYFLRLQKQQKEQVAGPAAL